MWWPTYLLGERDLMEKAEFKIGDRVRFEPDGDIGVIVKKDGVEGGHPYRVRWSSNGIVTYPKAECLTLLPQIPDNGKPQ
jgi:hypothetical protein